MRIVLDDVESICTARFHVRSKSNMELDCFPILASYYYFVIRENEKVSGIRQRFLMRRPCIRYLSKMDDLRQQKCMRAETMAVSGQARS